MITKLTLTVTSQALKWDAKRWMGATSFIALCALIFSLSLLLSACGGGSSTGQDGSGGTSKSASGQSDAGTGSGTTGGAGATGTGSGAPATVGSVSYLITVYYTAVESFHTDAAQQRQTALHSPEAPNLPSLASWFKTTAHRWTASRPTNCFQPNG